MLCDKCKKNEATFHKSVMINGKGYETNLCDACAREMNFDTDFDFNDVFDFGFDGQKRYNSIASEFFDDFMGLDDFFAPNTVFLERNTKKCPNCHSTFNDFLRTGKLGCDRCYDEFQEEIRDMLENMDNPTDLDLEIGTELNKIQPSKLDELTKEFNKAIEEERYEDAGKLKQQINELRKDDDKKENN